MINKTIKLVTLSAGFLFPALLLAQAKCYKLGKEIPCEELAKQAKGFLGWGLGIFAAVIVIGIVVFIFWIMMLIHAISKPIENKGMWVILMVFTGIIGALIYYFVVKRKFSQISVSSN